MTTDAIEHPANEVDVVVIGGGAAGLSAGTTLGRSRRSVVVVDAGDPRNAPAAGVHNLLGREGMSPAALYAAGRGEVEQYGGEVRAGTVVAARRRGDGFEVDLADGSAIRSRRLIIATGLVDERPAIDGLAERWGRDVIHCPFCHGWEVRDQAIGVLATGPFAAHQVGLFRALSDDVVLFLHTEPALSDEQAEELAARGVRVVEGEVVGIESSGDRLTGVRLASGEVVARDAVTVTPRFVARTAGLAELGLTVAAHPMGEAVGTSIQADPTGLTTVPGVWVAGNAMDLMATVGGAADAGVRAAAMAHFDLVAADTRAAVAAHRARLAAAGAEARA